MRTRARPDEQDRQPEAREREDTRRVRVPKIQYRFLKEIEEKGITDDARKDALAMADKIKRFPLEPAHVMGSWERFTKKAIEEFKSGRGKNDERDRQHVAYAVVFASMRDNPPANDVDHLKARIRVTAEQLPARERPIPAPSRQQELIERERPPVDKQVDAALARLRELSPELRSTIEASARELLIEGHHTARSARDALPAAVRDLQAERSEKNTVHTLTLAVVAKTADHPTLVREVAALPPQQSKDIEAEARSRLERYPPLETGLADVRKHAVDAAVRDAVSPSAETRQEVLVLTRAREDLERVADPKRLRWEHVADDLARDLA